MSLHVSGGAGIYRARCRRYSRCRPWADRRITCRGHVLVTVVVAVVIAPFVGISIAVVVDSVACLGVAPCIRSQSTGIAADAVFNRVPACPHAAGRRSKTLVLRAVAVVIDAIADFRRAGVDGHGVVVAVVSAKKTR